MANTKFSGLAAVASFLTTHEWGVNEGGTSKKVNGLQIKQALANGTAGSTWYAQITATQGAITAQTDLTGLTVTITPIAAGRRFKITGYCLMSSTLTTGQGQLYIMEGATQLQVATQDFAIAALNVGIIAIAVVLPTNAAHTYKLQAAATTGTSTAVASATAPAFILVEDIGT